MKPLPATVNILGQSVKIVVLNDDPDATELGSFESDTMTITVLNRPDIEKLIAHEVAHCILAITGITNLIEEDVEEAIATAFEYGFSALYKRDF